jgi:hypothetical protein
LNPGSDWNVPISPTKPNLPVSITPQILIEATSASLGGLVSSTALFPLEIIKTKMQAMDTGASKGPSSEEKGQHTGDEENVCQGPSEEATALGVANGIYEEAGVLGFYKGVHFSSLQSMMEKGLYFIAYTGLKSVWRAVSGSDDIGTLPNLGLGCAAEWCQVRMGGGGGEGGEHFQTQATHFARGRHLVGGAQPRRGPLEHGTDKPLTANP